MSGGRPEIWVVCETRAGKILAPCFELTGEAARLARLNGSLACAVLLDREAEAETGLLFAAGADKVYHLRPDASPTDDAVFAASAAHAAAAFSPETILIPATVRGRSVAPQIAARLRTGLTADCTGFHIGADGLLVQTRPAFGGSLLAEIVCATARPQMAGVRPKVFPQPVFDHSRSGEIVTVPVAAGCAPIPELLRATPIRDQGPALSEAAVVLGGGMGLGSKEGFAKLAELAKIIGASPGASRAAVHAGYAPYAWQVGQTGTSVRPRLYVAFGISGAAQHLAGMRAAERIIAVNHDPKAPIFRIAHIGIVADARSILDLLLLKTPSAGTDNLQRTTPCRGK